MEQDLQVIARRVDRLERQNLWLRRVLFLAVLVPGAAMLLATQQSVPQRVEAESFVVKDATGRTLAVLGRHGEYHGLNLYDARGRLAASLARDRDGTSLALKDERGSSATISAANTAAGVAVSYPGDEVGAALGVKEGGPDLTLRDRQGKVVFHRPE